MYDHLLSEQLLLSSLTSIGVHRLGSPPLDEDIHLLADVNRHLGLVKLVDDLQDSCVDPLGAVAGERFLSANNPSR